MNLVLGAKSFLGRNLIVKEWLDDERLTEARKDKCARCPMFKDGSCKVCKCVIEVKSRSKVSINIFSLPPHYEDTHCPMGKWPVRLENGEIGGSDLDVCNYWRKKKGKSEIK